MVAVRPRRPRHRAGLVRRERLLRRLAANAEVPLATVVAPAGYGKSTLLTEWDEADRRPFAWLTLDRGDNDPDRLVATVAAALHALEPLPHDALRPRTTRRSGVATALGPLARALESGRRPAVLVLDDVHVLDAAASLDVLGVLSGHMGAGSQLVLASRAELPLPLSRLRAQGDVVELRTRDLTMNAIEAEQLLRDAGLVLSAAELEAVVGRTEGWPAALQLAARSLREQQGEHARGDRGGARADGAPPAQFAGDDRLLADYVRDEVLAPLTADEVAFLIGTAPLAELSGELCDAVLRRRGSGRTLRALARSTLLLFPLDRSEERFRCHPLLAEMLRAELRQTRPGGAVEVHRRASRWHERAGDHDAAVDDAIAAGDGERAGELLWRGALASAAGTHAALLARRLRRLGEERIRSSPALALTAAVSSLLRGDRDDGERYAAAAERRLDADRSAIPRSLAAGVAVVRAALARDGLEPMRAESVRAQALDERDGPWRAFACLLEGTALRLAGEAAAGSARLEDAVRADAVTTPLIQALGHAQLASDALEDGDWERGAALAGRARHQVDCNDLRDCPHCALVLAVSAFARAHRDTAEAARRDVAGTRRLLALPTDLPPWFDAQVRIALARAELRLSNSAEARTLLADASRALQRAPDAVALHASLDAAWARADDFAVGFVQAPAALTVAELRVLRLLPSHFCFPEIATRLHLSVNTVKSQAQAVYRKLDVSSRSEAVARARGAGLVDGQALDG